MQGPAVEQHHIDVDALITRGTDAVAQAIEVGLVERRQIEFGLAVFRRAGAGSGPRLRRHAQMETPPRGLRLKLLPAPQSDEVVPVLFQKREIRGVIEWLR